MEDFSKENFLNVKKIKLLSEILIDFQQMLFLHLIKYFFKNLLKKYRTFLLYFRE